MKDRCTPPPIEIEREISDAIRSIGGRRVDSIIGKSDKKNADFLFDEYCVIAELKVLEKDQVNSPNFVKRCSEIYARYLKSGRAPVRVFGTVRLSTERFPEEFTREIAGLYANPIARVVRSADIQIESTKCILDRPDHKGILLLVNDGNTALDPSHVIWALGSILKGGAFPNINGVIFFTVNMPLVDEINSDNVVIPKKGSGSFNLALQMNLTFYSGLTDRKPQQTSGSECTFVAKRCEKVDSDPCFFRSKKCAATTARLCLVGPIFLKRTRDMGLQA